MQSCRVADGLVCVPFDWMKAAPQSTSLRQNIGIDIVTSRLWNVIHRHGRAAKLYGVVSGLQGQTLPTPSPIAKRGGRGFDSSGSTVRAATCCLGFDSNLSIKLSIVQRHWAQKLIEGILLTGYSEYAEGSERSEGSLFCSFDVFSYPQDFLRSKH
jgi:hypothetical protein